MSDDYYDDHGSHEEMDIFEEYERILAAYQKQERTRNLIGVGISVAVHAVVFVLAFLFIRFDPPADDPDITVQTVTMELKEIEPEIQEKLEEIEREVETVVPTISVPEVNPETSADISTDELSDATAGVDTDFNPLANLAFRTPNTAYKMPGMMQGRRGSGRAATGRAFGISGASEAAVLKALRWLAEHQNEDGSWSKKYQPAMAGTCLLAFLAHGDTPATSKEFGTTVQKALDYLCEEVNKAGPKGVGPKSGYTNGIVAYALCEAYAMTSLPYVKIAAEKSLGAVLAGQQPGGGFNYGYGDSHGKGRWDLSVSSWQYQAMKAATVGGLALPGLEEGKIKGAEFLTKYNFVNGKFSYSNGRGKALRGSGSGGLGMQGAGTLALQLLGHRTAPEAKAGVESVMAWKPEWKKCGHDSSYSWYYMVQAVFHAGRKEFKTFNKPFSTLLIKNQADAGYWNSPSDKFQRNGAPKLDGYNVFLDTSLNALSLQVAYRYLPSYKSTTMTATTATTGRGQTDDVFDLDDDELGIELK